MAVDAIQLPKNKAAIARILARHSEREDGRLAYRRTIWLLAWYYLNGFRRFDVFDPASGSLSPHYLDEEGNFEFQSQTLLYMINQVAGRLMNMDARGKVTSPDTNITGARNASIAQIFVDGLVRDDHLRVAQEQFGYLFACLGSCGIQGHLVDHPTIGLTSDIEVIHPRELYPFPSLGQDHTRARGLMRERMVPVSFLSDKFGRRIRDNMDDMEWYETEAGQPWMDDDETHIENVAYSASRRGGGGSSYGIVDGEHVPLVRIRELWMDGPGGTCSRYIIASGEYVIEDRDFSGQEVYCPVGVSRFFNNGTWHGAGMFDVLFSIHREMERLMRSLFNNIRDLDRYGVLVIPQGQMSEKMMLREVGRGLRVLPWDPDPVAEGFRPFAIQPYNAGDIPGRTAQFAREVMDSINPVRDLIEEKGRIDSGTGLQALDEQIQRALTSPTMGVVSAFGATYRALVGTASRHLAGNPRSFPVYNYSLDLAGAVIDQQDGTVSFEQNPLPRIGNLQFTVRQVSPRSEVARKQESLDLLERGVIPDPDAFILFALKEGLDFAMWMEEDKAAYETVIRNCLTIFGDGRAPGQIVTTPHIARPELQLRVLNAFMARPIIALATPEVQDALADYREDLIDYMGLTLPNAVPNPDDVAILQEGRQAPPMGDISQMGGLQLAQ